MPVGMRYRVTGTQHEKAARMTLELEADSKAAAERKARNAGMDVQHVHEIGADDGSGDAERRNHRGQDDGSGSRLWLKLLIVLAILAVAAYFAWPSIRSIVSSLR